MQSFYKRLVSYFLPADQFTSNEDERRSLLVINISYIALLFALLVFVYRIYTLGSANSYTVWLLPVIPGLGVASLFAIKYKRNYNFSIYFILIMGSLLLFMRSYTTGGIFSPVSIWLVALPTVAYLLLPAGRAHFWVITTLILLYLLAYPETFNLPEIAYESNRSTKLIVISLLVGMISFMIFSFETERKKNEAKIIKAEGALAASNKLVALGNVSGGFAHEINNPLSVIKTQATILNLELKNSDHLNAKEGLQDMLQAVGRIENIVNALRPFTKDNFFANAKPLDLNSIIKDVVQEKEKLLQESGIKVQFEINSQSLFVGIQDFTFRIISNLLDNSISALSGSNGSWVKFSITEKDKMIILTYSDSGAPLKKEIYEKIFDPFFTTKDHLSNSGLGLTICYNLMKTQSGNIRYLADAPHISFELTFPKSKS